MTEPPGVQPALGIESVEWSTSGGERLMVRVTGRWLRRPAAPRGQAMLVVAADTQRHRFPAMPDPPSVGGTPPGAWRVSFSLPAWLAPYLSRRLSLQIGGVIVPLPGARSANPDSPAGEQTVLDAPEATEGGFSLSLEAGFDPDELSDTEARVRGLEREVEELRRRSEPLDPYLPESAPEDDADSDEPLERLSQTAPIAEALRQEMELARRVPAVTPAAPAHETTQPHGLMSELEMLAGRRHGPQPPSRPSPSPAGQTEMDGEDLERTLAGVRSELELRTESEARLSGTVAALRRELQARTASEANLRAALATVQGSLDARTATQTALESRLDELRSELTGLRLADDYDGFAQAEAEARATELAGQLSQLQFQLDEMRSQLLVVGDDRDRAQAEAAMLRDEISALHSELAGVRATSEHDAATLAQAETLLTEAHHLAADAEQRLAAEHLRAQEAVAAREQVEREFAEYRERSIRVHAAIEELRHQLAALRGARTGVVPDRGADPTTTSAVPIVGPTATEPPPATPTPPATVPADPSGEVAPERLTEALSRLRENVPPPDVPAIPEASAPPEPSAKRKSWLKSALRGLTAEDPETAGRVVVGLLPAQSTAAPRKVSYDLVLGEQDVVLVTVGERVEIERRPAPRELEGVDFRVTGDLASLARLVSARGVRMRRHMPKISGDRGQVSQLRSLARSRLSLRELHAAGVRLPAPELLHLAASMVKAGWTYDYRFTIAHELDDGLGATTYLNVREGRAPTVSGEAPTVPATTTLVCSAESLLLLLGGERRADVELRGDERPLVRLQQWLERATSG